MTRKIPYNMYKPREKEQKKKAIPERLLMIMIMIMTYKAIMCTKEKASVRAMYVLIPVSKSAMLLGLDYRCPIWISVQVSDSATF